MTVFIGPNSAGKSNILDALALLRDVFNQVAMDATERRLDLNLISQVDDSIYYAPLAYTALASEHAHLGKIGLDTTVPRDLYDKIEQLRDELQLASTEAAVERLLTEAVEKWQSLNGKHNKVVNRDELVVVGGELSSYRLVHLDSARLREPSERIGSDTLAPDASNLPTVLANLPGPTLGEIRADLVSLVPGVSSFEIVPDGDSFRIDFEFSGGERMPARLVSDGTLRILALLTALRVEPRSAMIGVEEPENGVYPGRLRKLVEYMQEIAEQGSEDGASPTQLVLTTHSPVVLAALRAQPELLRFVDLVRRDGQLATRARTVSATPGPDRGRLSISLREIDELLHAADSEIGQ